MEPRSICSATHLGPTSLLHSITALDQRFTARSGRDPCPAICQRPNPQLELLPPAATWVRSHAEHVCAIAWMPNESNIDVSETRSGERRGSSDGHPLTPNDPPLLPCYRPKHSHAPRDSCANREQRESLPGRVCQGASKCAPADCVRDGLITWGWWSARAMHGGGALNAPERHGVRT